MYGGHLRVSDADRQQAVRLLDAALADGRLTADDHAQRRSEARAAVTFDDIVPVTRDLVATADVVSQRRSQELATLARSAPVPVPAPTGQDLPTMWQLGLLGGAERKGVWHAPAKINAVTLEDVKRVAARVLGGARVTAVVGPQGTGGPAATLEPPP